MFKKKTKKNRRLNKESSTADVRRVSTTVVFPEDLPLGTGFTGLFPSLPKCSRNFAASRCFHTCLQTFQTQQKNQEEHGGTTKKRSTVTPDPTLVSRPNKVRPILI